MKIRPIRWFKSGYGVRFVDLPTIHTRELNTAYVSKSRPLRCAYWQIWQGGAERRVIDRALSYKKARERIKAFEAAGGPLLPAGVEKAV